jgi:HK97 family phage major capsid protein
MNIAKLIAKFVKKGYSSLTDEEKALLKENKSLMTEEQVKKFDGEEAEGDDAGEDKEAEADDSVDEKALREMISKGVQSEISSKIEGLASELTAKFVAGVNEARKKAIDAGEKKVEGKKDETRKFLKALFSKDVEAMKEFKSKAVNTDDDDGAKAGLLIPEELRAEVLRLAQVEYGVARREMWYLPFSGAGNSRKIPTLASGITVFWTDEGAKKGGTQPVFGVITQTLKKLAAIIPFTEEILEDSAIDLTSLTAQLFAEAVSKEEDLQFFAGSGTPWTGIINNASVNVVSLGAGEVANDTTADDLLDMIDLTPAGALPGSKWYLNRTMLSVFRKLKDTQGNYIFQRPSETTPAQIWDFPYVLVEALPGKTFATANKGFLIFGNLKMSCVLGDKQAIRAKMLDQATITDGDGATVINLAEQDMVALRLEERVGYVIALPSAITVLKTGTSS